MPRWYIRRRGRYYRYGRLLSLLQRRYRRRYTPYSRRYVNASSRSSVRMKTVVTDTWNATAGYGSTAAGAVVVSFNPLAGTNDSLAAANSPLYRTYCSLYEECKCVGAKVSLAVVSAVGGSDIPSLQIYTSWDRKHGYQEPEYSASDIKNASTSNVATALNNNVAKLTRSCYASDLMEKATWFDATLDGTANNINQAWRAAALNPNMFCPAFFAFFNCPSLGATKAVSISVSVTYYFAFRNPRYGGSGGNAKLADLGARSVSFPDEDDGDMDAAAAAVPSADLMDIADESTQPADPPLPPRSQRLSRTQQRRNELRRQNADHIIIRKNVE